MPAAIDPLLAAQAMSLGDVGYNPRQAGSMVGLPGSTVREIVARHGRWGEVAERPVFVRLRAEQTKALEAAGRTLAAKALIQCEETLPKANAYQACLIASIMIDKSRLLAGESTENIAVNARVEFTGLDVIAEALSRSLINQGSEQSNTANPQSIQASTDLIK